MNDTLSRILSLVIQIPDRDEGLRRLSDLLEEPIDTLRASRTSPRFCYRPFTIRKRGGGKRRIVAPSSPLKLLQRRLLRHYLAAEPLHYAATAFRPGSSIARHARRHLGQAILLTVDLADFFPSTAARRIRGWFRERDWNGEALEILTRLTVYHGGLPQGAPTSPALSNLVNRSLDEEINELANRCGARYSRYCDDLAFSWGTDFEPPVFRRQVEDKLARFGYRIQPEKGWRLKSVDHQPEITGLVLAGNRLRLSDSILKRIGDLKSRRSKLDESERQTLQGYAGLHKMLR